MIIRARQVVTMEGPPIENGAVAIEGMGESGFYWYGLDLRKAAST